MNINIIFSILAFLIYGSTLFFQPFKYQKAILISVLFFTLIPFIFGFFPVEYSSDIFSVVLGIISVEVVKSILLKLYFKSKGIKGDAINKHIEEHGDISYYKIYQERKIKKKELMEIEEQKIQEEQNQAKEIEDEIKRKIERRKRSKELNKKG